MEFRRVQFWLFCLLVSVVLGHEDDEGRCLKKIIAKGFSVKPRLRVHRGPGQTKQIFIEYNEDENRQSFPDDYNDDDSHEHGKNTKAVIDLRDLCKFVGSDGKVFYQRHSRPEITRGQGPTIDAFSGYSNSPQTNFGGFSARGSSQNQNDGFLGQFNGLTYQGNGYNSFSNPSTGFNQYANSGQEFFGPATQGSFPQSSLGGFSTQGGGLLNQNSFSSQGQFNQNAGLFNQNAGFTTQGNGQFNQNAGLFNQNAGFTTQGNGQFNQNAGFQGAGLFNQNAGFSSQGAGQFNQNSGFSNQAGGLFNQNSGFSTLGGRQFGQNGAFSNQGFNQNGFGGFGNSGNSNFRNGFRGGPC